MPCGDITEKINISIDNNDRLVSYQFLKKTCGGSIGDSVAVEQQLIGMRINSIIGLTGDAIGLSVNNHNDIDKFLKLKHIHAIRTVIKAFLGLEPGGNRGFCTIEGIVYDGQRTVIDAEIKLDLGTERIKACDHCGPG